MYTLEDDHETSSHYKRDIANGAPEAGTFGGGEADVRPAGASGMAGEGPTGTVGLKQGQSAPLPVGQTHAHKRAHLSPQQFTGSMKTLTRPGKSNAGNQRIALAALTIACITVFFTALDQTVVVTALPSIVINLGIPIMQLDHAAWIVSAYLLGFVVVMPLMGRVSDIYGRRRIFLLCLGIFGVGSLLCALAPWLATLVDISFLANLHIDVSSPALTWLIAARFLQAIGGGAVVPIAMAIASDFYGKERRALALGIVGAVTEAGGALGPLYGAVVVQQADKILGNTSGWTWIFYLNIPLVIVLFIAASFLIPKGQRQREGIDWIGAILLGIALTCLSMGLAQQGATLSSSAVKTSVTPQNNPLALILAFVFLLIFALFELRIPRLLFKREARWPLIDLKLFKRFPFSAASLVSLFVGAALIIAMADIPIFVETVMQGSVLDSGLALLRMTVMIPIGAILGGWLCSRISCRVTGIIGLLFIAVGFYMMSLWPMHVDWNEITISALTSGLGFGLVVAPIGTTAINTVKATQAGLASSIVTALRMVGMILGLAALTSWALGYFRQLALQYTSPDYSGYAAYLLKAAHTVYNTVFFAAMILTLIAIVPAIFLWGRSVPVTEVDVAVLPDSATPILPDAVTLAAMGDEDTLTRIPTAPLQTQPGLPPIPPTDDMDGKGGRNPKRRRMIIAIASVVLVLLLIGGGVLAAVMMQPGDTSNATQGGSNTGATGAGTATATPISGPRMLEIALDKTALTSIFVSQLNIGQAALSDMYLVPTPNDGLIMGMNLHIDANGIHRVIPIELDTAVGVDAQQNLVLTVQTLKRDGVDAGQTAAASMQSALNRLLATTLMPALRSHLGSAQLVGVHTSSSVACGKGAEMFVLLIKAPPIQGIAAQPTPVPFCFSGPVDLNKLLPS